MGCNGQAWCDAFVDDCFVKAYGKDTARQLLGGFSNYTPTSAQYFKNMKRWHSKDPMAGDQIFFKNSIRICHTGLVYKVDASRVYTIEGNTSGAGGVIANRIMTPPPPLRLFQKTRKNNLSEKFKKQPEPNATALQVQKPLQKQ